MAILNHGFSATGFLVAPSLVMTARHVAFDNGQADQVYFHCEDFAPVTQAYEPARFQILVGAHTPIADANVLSVKRIFAGPKLDFCADDIAIMQLEIPVHDIEPLQLRLDEGAREGEDGTLVGWGSNSEYPQINIGTQRFQIPLQVLRAGRDYGLPEGGTLGVAPSTFLTGEGACFGDSGGPFISKDTGAVVGVMTMIDLADPTADPGKAPMFSECLGALTVFQELSFQKDWIRTAFAEAGEAPWLEGLDRPAALGESCRADAECISALCAAAGTARFCSESCERQSCPDGMQCAGDAGSRFCIPERVTSVGAASGGCAIAEPCARTRSWGSFYFCAVMFTIRYRRRRAFAF